jgi:hypothetical protein
MLELKEVKKGSLKIIEIKRNSPAGQKLIEEIYKQRFESYSALGLIPFSGKKSKMVKDEFDESPYTTHFAIIENGNIIGSHRATKYSTEEKIPSLKDCYTLSLFQTKNTSISELSRLVLRQDRKYPGCVLQLVYNVINYTLNYSSEIVCSLANPSATALFEYIGAKKVNDEISYIIDKKENKEIIRGGIPMISNRSMLNHNLPLDKYKIDRTLVIITGE